MRGFFGFFAFFMASACGADKFSGADGGTTSGSDGMVADTGVMPGEIGCSDGTREVFVDRLAFPKIAGCSGGFSVAGTVTPASMSPMCGRNSGNSVMNVSGQGCSIEDLCQQGWHVCRSAADVRTNLPLTSASCQPPEAMPTGFWATRQNTNQSFQCATFDVANNIVGCGNVPIRASDVSCTPLTHVMTVTECNVAPWACNAMMSDAEAATVTKSSPYNGGVMCCSGT